MNKSKRDKNPFGVIFFNLQQKLYKEAKYAQAQFNFYVACRSNMAQWEYSESDIRYMTGITRNTVKGHCNAFVQAGIFLPHGTTVSGSFRYKLNKTKFSEYMKGSQPLEPVKDRPNPQEYNSPPVTSEVGGAVNGMQGGLSMNERGASTPLTANNKEKQKEENEDTHTRGRECVRDTKSPDAKEAVNQILDNKAALDEARIYFTGSSVSAIKDAKPKSDVAPTQRCGSVISGTSRVNSPSDVSESIADCNISASWSGDFAVQRLSKRQMAIWYKLRIQEEQNQKRLVLEQERRNRELAALRYKEYEESRTYTPRFEALAEVKWERVLTPSERAEYFCEYLKTMRANGCFDKEKNRRKAFRLVTTEESLKVAYAFFELNPMLEPDVLLKALERCCIVNVTESEPERGLYCEHFYQWKAGGNLAFFWKYFSNLSDVVAVPPPIESVQKRSPITNDTQIYA